MASRPWVGSAGPKRWWGDAKGLQATPPPSRGQRRAHSPPSHQHQWSSCAELARAGWRAARGHWLPQRDPRWAAVAHWLVASVRGLGATARPPCRPRPGRSGCWRPGGGGRPGRSEGLWPLFRNHCHPSVPVHDWQRAGGLPRGPQSFCRSRGGAAVAGRGKGGGSQAGQL